MLLKPFESGGFGSVLEAPLTSGGQAASVVEPLIQNKFIRK